MKEDTSIPVSVLLSRLVPLVSQDAELLAILRGLAEEFLRLTAAPEPAPPHINIAESEPTVPEPAAAPVIPASQHVPLPSAPAIRAEA